MKTTLLLHILLVGAWMGCIAVEALLENAPKKILPLREIIPQLHYKIDKFVELPLVLGVLVTGSLLLDLERLSGIDLVKVFSGLAAVLANLACWFPVKNRKIALDRGDKAEVKKQSLMILRWTQIGLPFAVIALVCGVMMFKTKILTYYFFKQCDAIIDGHSSRWTSESPVWGFDCVRCPTQGEMATQMSRTFFTPPVT